MVITTMRGAWLGVLLAMTGCGWRVNDEHCLFEGGDRACGDGRSCMIVIGGGTVPGATNGCLEASEAAALDPERHLHLRYGLPASLEPASTDDALESDTVLGIFARQVRDHELAAVCPAAEGLASVEGWSELELVLAARRRLDELRKERRVGDDETAVHPEEVAAVEDLGARVDAWVRACEGLLEGSSGESSGTTDTIGTTGTTDTGSTTAAPECTSNEDCTDPASPLCSASGECVSCDELPDPDAACAELDPQAPLCVGGACVQCTAATPAACGAQICDDATNTCVPCTEHDQCGGAACDMFTGECLPADAVVHVGPGLDFATICEAIASFPPDARGTIIVHAGSYVESCTVDSGRRLGLLAADGELPTWDSSGPQLTVVTGAAAFIEGLRIANNTSNVGLHMTGGQAWLDRVQLVRNDMGAQLAGGAQAVFRNSTVGILTGGGYTAIYAIDGASVEVLYSTIIGDAGSGNSLICDPTATVTARNSIVGNYDGNPIGCTQADVSYSVTTDDFPGPGNQNVGGLSTPWFVDYSSGDFHLSLSYADTFANIALWQTGDPPLDLDGDLRPIIDGTTDYAGADIP